ncbi:CHAT domain-containing protein [Solwaraspora sp. WMMD792]|uniref:CHAT domain-containing protein n=1 Tax=Solwaraspora sp. WMMD792 TaxID=3016099 RepID=UPI0024165D4C|nr:CHAT domain-containing protein [Solwaraspora sp. WMMD792]MDG4773610.1 hypothetical protein [Solwaraspora sp. WMMD792]
MTADTIKGADTTTTRPDAYSQPVAPPGVIVAPEGDESIAAEPMPLTGALPPNTALLRVDGGPIGEGRPCFRLTFQFRGTSRESRDVDVAQQVIPTLSLTDITQRETWLDDYRQVRGWWREMTRLRQWMQELLTPNPIRLIVWDNTPYQIPWELYYLHEPQDEDRSTWLGAKIEITRWTSLLQGPDASYDAERRTARGSMLLLEMLEPHANPDGVADLADRFGYRTLRDSDTWLRELARDDLRFALMMVHCHGENATDANQFTIAGLPLNELHHRPMPALAASRAVVVLNACNTAKVVPVGADVPRATRSFAEMFLDKGASAIIATVGEVDLDQTHDFTRRLVNGGGHDHRLSSILLSWRKYHVDRVTSRAPDDPDLTGRLKDFFHAFLYVYFGHPDSILQIIQDEAQ